MAKAALWHVTDAEARKRGEQNGLDRVNNECCFFYSNPCQLLTKLMNWVSTLVVILKSDSS